MSIIESNGYRLDVEPFQLFKPDEKSA